jgi:hypothetical protein
MDPEISTEDLELNLLLAAVQKSKQKLADAQALKQAAVRTAIATAESLALKKRAQEMADYESKVALITERRNAAEAEKKAETARKAQEQRAMVDELAKLELAAQAQQKRDALLQSLADDAARIEREAQLAEQDALRVQTVVVVEPEVNAMSPNHPLGHILHPEGFVAPAPVAVPVHVDPPQAPERRPVNFDEHQVVAGYFLQYAGVRVTSNMAKNLCSVWAPDVILGAIQGMAQRSDRSGFAEAVERFLWQSMAQ